MPELRESKGPCSRAISSVSLIASSAVVFFSVITSNAGGITYNDIIHLEKESGDTSELLLKQCDQFIRENPKSSRIPDVHMIAGRHEKSPSKSLSHYTIVIRQYPSYRDILPAYREACAIFMLSAQYEQVSRYARNGMAADRTGSMRNDFAVILVRSLILSQEYDDASAQLRRYSGSIDPAESAILKDELDLHTGSGIRLRKVQSPDSLTPKELFLAGKQFELSRNYTYAFSAYEDLLRIYPRSPESMSVAHKLDLFAKQKSAYTAQYLNELNGTRELNLVPDSEIAETGDEMKYSILIGPLFNLTDAKNLKKEMTGSFDHIVLVKSSDGFYIYVGRESTAERALALKIRLAEEFALNGKIAQRKEENGREYIYGE